MMGLRVYYRPFCDFSPIEIPDMVLINPKQLKQRQVIRPLNDIDMKNQGLLHLSPKDSFQSKSTGYRIRISIDKNRQRIFQAHHL
jgi:hypothetical protein